MDKIGISPDAIAALTSIYSSVKPGADFTKISLPELQEVIKLKAEFFDYVDHSVEKAFMVTDKVRIEGQNVIDAGDVQLKVFASVKELFEYYWKYIKTDDHGLFQ